MENESKNAGSQGSQAPSMSVEEERFGAAAEAVEAEVETGAPREGELTGARLGRYLVLERLGRGGMGVVYKAYDSKLDRRVALKVLRIKENTKEPGENARERLLREAQALAQLAHPNVVPVFDVGTVGQGAHGDAIYMTMEYVEGKTLKQWLRERKPSLRQILETLAAAGRGIAAAHQAGLIHRDIKPQNIIIGNDGRVRVLDFGLARSVSLQALNSDAPLRPDSKETYSRDLLSPHDDTGAAGKRLLAPLTEEGRVVGTPGYMAPEQYLGTELNPKTDQFSFCVTLYEAVYGRKPFSAKSYRALRYKVAVGRIDPEPPGSKVPAWLRRILLKGLSVRDADRYPSMDALLDDLARDPRLFWRRVGGVAAGATILALLATVLLVSRAREQRVCQGAEGHLAGVWDEPRRQAVQAAFQKSGRPFAQDTTARVEKLLDERAAAWVAMRTEACEATQLRGEQSQQLLDLRMQCLDQRLAELRALCELFARRADGEVVERAVQATEALAPLSRCADVPALLATLARVKPPKDQTARAQIDEIRPRLAAAKALCDTGKYQDGIAVADELAAAAAQVGYPPLQAEVALQQGRLQKGAGAYALSESRLNEAWWFAEAAGDDEIKASALNELTVVVGYMLARPAEGARLSHLAEAVLARGEGGPALQARWHSALGAVAYAAGEYPKALEHYQHALAINERELGADHSQVAQGHNDIGSAFYRLGQDAQAREHYRRSLEITTQVLGPTHPSAGKCLNNLGNVSERMGDYDKAVDFYRQALLILEKALGPEHPDIGMLHNNLGGLYSAMDDFPRAIESYQRALKIQEHALGSAHPDLGMTYNNLGLAYSETGAFDKALQSIEQALAIRRKALGPEHTALAFSYFDLGQVHTHMGRYEDAIADYRRALSLWERALGPDHLSVAATYSGLGQVYLLKRSYDEALVHFQRALTICEKTACGAEVLPELRFGLAQALRQKGCQPTAAERGAWRWGDRASCRREALKLPQQTHQELVLLRYRKQAVKRVERWLAEHPAGEPAQP